MVGPTNQNHAPMGLGLHSCAIPKYLASFAVYLGALYIEGPFGCRPKSFKFQSIGLLGIVKLGLRALYWGPIQISSHPTWRSTWHKFSAKTLDLSKEIGPRFSLAPITKFGAQLLILNLHHQMRSIYTVEAARVRLDLLLP
jgi:hypothetical protein